METSRREFLKTTAGVGACMALPGIASATTSLVDDGERAAPGVAREVATTAPLPYTRGIGLYPGSQAENFGPSLQPDASGTYRNLALFRPAFHSSSYDYNLTAQLVTDGIKDTHAPDWMVCLVDGRTLPKQEREIFVDHFPENVLVLPESEATVEIHFGGGTAPPAIDRLELFAVVPDHVALATLSFAVSVSDDTRTWQRLASVGVEQSLPPENYPPDLVRSSHVLAPSIPLGTTCQSRYYRVHLGTTATATAPNAERSMWQWRLGQAAFYRGAQRVEIGGPYSFTSAWKSAGLGREWVYVDLGARFAFDRVTLHWIARAAEGVVQVSDDAEQWHDVQPLPANDELVDDLRLAAAAEGRYVRVLMTRPSSADGYILSELEVFGRGGFLMQPSPTPPRRSDGSTVLAGGGWRLKRAEQETGETLSKLGFDAGEWMIATVPGTTLTSYLNAGAIPDPNFGQNQLHLSDSYFYADFWYRTEFLTPATEAGQHTWLHFDGVNWKAEVFLNGESLGHIDGGFLRGVFDVTAKLTTGTANALAIRVLKNATPGSVHQKTFETAGKNGGALGADNPTFHASVGWDWIPTIRGRNTGIWGDVRLESNGGVTLEDPLVSSTLLQTRQADVTIEVLVTNHTGRPIDGVVRGQFGVIRFESRVHLADSTEQVVTFSPATHPQLRIANPQLWWPVGYGEPHLHDVELRFEDKRGTVLNRKTFKAGIRQITHREESGALKLWINGRRFIARGGNWGFGESMLRYRAREYDSAVRYHREMNFTMIRNWVGQIGDEAFYEACDRHGVVVWQDFWLANPWDGPIPNDNAMFLANAKNYIRRIRSHPSIGIYCGRNEWYPPSVLETGLRKLLAEEHADMPYIPSSADGGVSGHGPYLAMPPSFYFRTADVKLHSELGAPAIPSMESVRAMMPEDALWPQGLDWGLHDFTLAGAQGGAEFRAMIDDYYGGADSAEEWVSLAQFLNYDCYRAMFEAQGRYRMGLLLWMSHPCWPSFVWQTYDYYLEPTSAYFGCKKGSEPLHIQWNSLSDTVEVVNYSAGDVSGLTAEIEILNIDGRSMMKKDATLTSAEDSLVTVFEIAYPPGLSPVHFMRLTLSQNGRARSTNVYLRPLHEGDYRAIRTLRPARVLAETDYEQHGQQWLLTSTLRNTSAWPALHVRLKAVRERSGDRILPAIYDDNYITLLPGESRIIRTELANVDTRGEKPRLVVGGFNVVEG